MDVQDRKRNTIYKIKTVCVITGGILVHLCLGSFYIFGNISPYMISYLRNRTNEHTLRNEDNLWIANAASLATPFALITGGLLDRYLGVRIATGIGCVLFCYFRAPLFCSSGVALTYFTIKKSLVFVALSYGVLTNFGSFVAYGPPAQTAVKFLPERPTFAVGMIVCGFGGGALIFNQVVTAFINPDNLSPDLETADGERYFTNKAVLDRIPSVFLLLAGIYICAQFLGVLLIFTHPSDKKEIHRQDTKKAKASEYGAVSEEEESVNGETNEDVEDEKTVKAPVKTVLLKVLTNKNAYIWWFILFLIYGGMTFANSLYKAYGQTFISDDHFLALVGSISSIFNCIFRPIWGIIMDKYGFQVAVKIASTCFVCLSCTIMHTESLGKVAFLLWICGLYGSSSCVWAIGPATLAKLFGVEHMAINMGFIFIAVTAAAITGGFVGLNLQSDLGWHGLFLLAGFMGATAFLLTFFFDGKDTEGRPI